ncbi:16S rRNA (cytosine(1402)-N(4))-methyltransferase RsmH [Chamaesiphon minutus]|uniref:Ribosomal RNA small subunit methyltransferase H n=1 Tax=Chamaesiphon minutus (strain ATCC 27169 / PCC 6605) TaxID=1173020 RepID=K9UJY6_CHAP6|nr:16S rRNA (cytosine(1402)-N(4))-methyltransferase RsmH [Chamaesiphon minutus]AFY94973.1 S-adenosyl-methyltransferase MraW [Chamaesiphon minutus PCC 6605]
MDFLHIPVLSQEIVAGLEVVAGGYYLDATVGGGGHSELILQAAPDVRLVAIDRDLQALDAAKNRLAPYGERVTFWHGNYADYQPSGGQFDGIIADLGVSSVQLDLAERGFSFRNEAPLDMRMDRSQGMTAADLVNQTSEVELARIIFTYGEERLSRQIAREIVAGRPFTTTTQLAYTIGGAVPKSYRYGRIHPATRTFQALRIVVNQELSSLEKFLAVAPTWLKPEGKIGLISFHSLEDRIVKHTLRENELLKVLTKKPIIASDAEIASNPRARSAKLRWAVLDSPLRSTETSIYLDEY